MVSWEYHETIMAAAGHQAEANLEAIRTGTDPYILIVEGSIPTAENGIYCTIGGKTAIQILQEMAANAALVIAVGACAWDGGFPRLGPTGAVGVGDIIGNKPLVNLGGCPHNVANTAAVLVHYLTFGSAPALDQYKRPLFAYGHLIHDQCERRANFDAGRFVEQWGDEGHRNGWCLYKMGCKGPAATYNCPIVRWNDGTNWPIGAGHGCIACASPQFWARMSPFYDRLPNVQMFGGDVTAQTIGLAAIGFVAVATAIHAGGVVTETGERSQEGDGGRGRHRRGRGHVRTHPAGRRRRPELGADDGRPNRHRSRHADRGASPHRGAGRGGRGQVRLLLRDDVPGHGADPPGPRPARGLDLGPAHLRRLHDGPRAHVRQRGRGRARHRDPAERRA